MNQRELRKKKRAHRLAVLEKISAVQDTHCNGCHERVLMWQKYNESVAAYTCQHFCKKGKEIAALGKELHPAFDEGLEPIQPRYLPGIKRRYTKEEKDTVRAKHTELLKKNPKMTMMDLVRELDVPIGTLHSWRKKWRDEEWKKEKAAKRKKQTAK